MAWLMCAGSKGFRVGPASARLVLRFAHDLARARVRERRIDDARLASLLAAQESPKSLSPRARCLVRALRLRAHFGGMPGDVKMLRAHARLWARRLDGAVGAAWPHGLDSAFRGADGGPARAGSAPASGASGRASAPSVKGAPGPEANTLARTLSGRMRREDVELAGIDFHCCPWMAGSVLDAVRAATPARGGALSRDDVEAAVWHMRSGINRKTRLASVELDAGTGRFVLRAAEAGGVAAEGAAVEGAAVEARHAQTWSVIKDAVAAFSRSVVRAKFSRAPRGQE
jgi:hypothetical protein